MKKLLSLFLWATMLLSCLVMTVSADKVETTPEKLSDIFTDTPEGAWYEEYVLYAYTRGLVSGMGDGTFAPNSGMTRAQLVTILYRMEGSPDVAYSPVFGDVAENDWFAKAVLWASSEKIVSGKGDGIFAPGDGITREQIAMILYRYAESKDYDVTSRSTVMNKFPDSGSVSSYAEEAMSWAVYERIISGKALGDGTNILAPGGSATRAEVSVMLQRFIEDYSLDARPFEIYTASPNVMPDNMELCGVLSDMTRMPDEIAAKVNEGVRGHAKNPTGGRIRFKTDSDAIEVTVTLAEYTENSGFDIMVNGEYRGTFSARRPGSKELHGTVMLDDGSEDALRDITVYLPRVGQVERMDIGLDTWAAVEKPDAYTAAPIVYYGSSITQGATCPSPSKIYPSLVSEALGADFINLGFGGSAMGEREMAEYIASLEMSAFVLDYDLANNAPSVEYLKETHKEFFDIIRAAHPDMPILIMSRSDMDIDYHNAVLSRRVVLETFYSAVDAGDTHVDFVDGFYLWGNYDRDTCTSDGGVHPNETGHARMTEYIIPRLRALMARP